MKLSKIFEKLEKLFSDKDRWIKGGYTDTTPTRKHCYCLIGGLCSVQKKDPGGYIGLSVPERKKLPGYSELFQLIKQGYVGGDAWVSTVEEWNDQRNRTIKEVRALIRRAKNQALKAEKA